MSLNLAFDIARGGLSTSSTATSVVSRNIANVGDPDASRKTANIVSSAAGGVHVDGIGNAVDVALFESLLEANSSHGELAAISDAHEQLESIILDPELGHSPAALVGELGASLQAAAAAPHDESVARAAISSAVALAQGLNAAAQTVDAVRAEADSALARSVERLQTLLDDFEEVNNQVVSGTVLGTDTTDALDRRNGLLREMSWLVELRSTVRTNNDVVLFAANGATLFETVPRSVAIDPTATLAPGQPGGTLRIDGVPASPAGSGALGGTIGGLIQVRDVVGVTFGRQLDEVARGLIVAFAESDQSVAPAQPDLAGLFTYGGGPALPPSGVISDGLAAQITVNPNVDVAQGGLASRLRDGGISVPGDPSYVYNSANAAGFADRLRQLVDRLSGSQPFDQGAGLGTGASVREFAADSAGWLEQARQTSSGKLADKSVLSERANAAWQNRVGVNLDEELTELIALERSYQASTRLISSVNGMFDALFRATG